MEIYKLHAGRHHPFGMPMPGRSLPLSNYRFGFNGKEEDDEVKGNGNSLDFGDRIYDPRLGRFFSQDPDKSSYSKLSPYQGLNDNPINFIDPTGKGGKPQIEFNDKGQPYILVSSTAYIFCSPKKAGNTSTPSVISGWPASVQVSRFSPSTKFLVIP